MTQPTARPRKSKSASLHPRNPHSGRYDMEALCKASPELSRHIITNPRAQSTINFADAKSVLALNKALLKQFYQIDFWQIPEGYLCPPIPGRADYIHTLSDLLLDESGEVTKGNQVHIVDVGTGANCIYPIVGAMSYGWRFTASDIDPVAVNNAKIIASSSPRLSKKVAVMLQKDKQSFFKGIINKDNYYAATMCNPPFHASMQDAIDSNQRKRTNLAKKGQSQTNTTSKLNFGGQNAELWCKGGELAFLKQMAIESVDFKENVGWFTSLVSKQDNLETIKALLTRLGASEVLVVNMTQGQKISRMLAWQFETSE